MMQPFELVQQFAWFADWVADMSKVHRGGRRFPSRSLDTAVLSTGRWGRAVTGLFRMNSLGRPSVPSPAHQIRLLKMVGDNLDCLYLHLRAVGLEFLVLPPRVVKPPGRRVRRRADL